MLLFYCHLHARRAAVHARPWHKALVAAKRMPTTPYGSDGDRLAVAGQKHIIVGAFFACSGVTSRHDCRPPPVPHMPALPTTSTLPTPIPDELALGRVCSWLSAAFSLWTTIQMWSPICSPVDPWLHARPLSAELFPPKPGHTSRVALSVSARACSSPSMPLSGWVQDLIFETGPPLWRI